MTTQTLSETKQDLVQDMRAIREQISREIKDMSFEQERAYLDNLLAAKMHEGTQKPHNTWGANK